MLGTGFKQNKKMVCAKEISACPPKIPPRSPLGSLQMKAINLGVIAGTVSKPTHSFWGVSGQMGLIVPTLKLEIEWMRSNDEQGINGLTAGIMIRPKFGSISPYGVFGVGTEFDSISFQFSRYDSFSFLGFGAHLFLMDVLSLRADLRFQNFAERKRFRFSAGLFVHL